MEKKTLGGFQLCILIINAIAVVIIFQKFSNQIESREFQTKQEAEPKWKLVKTTEQQFVSSITRDPVTGKVWKIAETVKAFFFNI